MITLDTLAIQKQYQSIARMKTNNDIIQNSSALRARSVSRCNQNTALIKTINCQCTYKLQHVRNPYMPLELDFALKT